MFWGLIMEPQRRYTQVVKKAFHISMAALDVGTSSDEPAQVMCSFEGRNYLLCTLSKTVLQCPLDLNFEVGDEISLTTNGKCHIHLTGYLVEEANDFLEEEEEEEEVEEEVEQKEVKAKNKKRNKQELNGPSPKKLKKEQEESDDEADSDIDVNALLENTLSSDDDDESFNGEDNEEEEAEEEESADGGEEEDESGDEEAEDSWESDGDSEEEVEVTKKAKLNGHVKQEQQTPNEKDKKNKKQKNKEAKNTPVKENQSPKKDSPKKLVQGGMIIEEIKEGQGPPAKSGKFISVYYEGRLKNNNKMFDSHKQGQGFGFKLGSGEVIKGWDVGLVGMKVGGKRRITCPPHMAYGAKGSPPAIPGNSTLVFEVELKKIR